MVKSGEQAVEDLIKAIATIILSIIFGIAAHIILTKYADKTTVFSILIDLSSGAMDDVLKILSEKITIISPIADTIATNKEMYYGLQVYWLSSMPFGYYTISKIFGFGYFSILIIGLKLVATAILSPIIMPIALIIAIISIIRNAKILADE